MVPVKRALIILHQIHYIQLFLLLFREVPLKLFGVLWPIQRNYVRHHLINACYKYFPNLNYVLMVLITFF